MTSQCRNKNVPKIEKNYHFEWLSTPMTFVIFDVHTALILLLKKVQIKSNQIYHYTRCNTPKRVTSLRGPSRRHCAGATQLLSKKCRSGGELLATLCLI